MVRFRGTFALLLLAVVVTYASAQQPSPSPPVTKDQEPPVRVFTEEVRLPIVALDAYGHYDPTLELDDILVLEDGRLRAAGTHAELLATDELYGRLAAAQLVDTPDLQ